jgi:hypothetical protein
VGQAVAVVRHPRQVGVAEQAFRGKAITAGKAVIHRLALVYMEVAEAEALEP